MKFGLALSIGLALSFQLPFFVNKPTIEKIGENIPISLSQYQSQQVLRVNTLKELKVFLHSQNELEYNIWGEFNHQTDIQIDSKNLLILKKQFPGLEYSVIIEDLPQAISETFPKAGAEELSIEDIAGNSEILFREYRPLSTINAWLEMLEHSYPDVINVETIGETYEHREYKIVHFSVPNGEIPHDEKKTMVITAGIHAREWISTSSVLYILFQLIEAYNEDPNSEALKNLNFLLIPVANPDGYEYTWNSDRLWRKNRQKTVHPLCFGIDIDHSYNYHWTKSSDWPCGEEYSGEFPNEALETQIWNDYLNSTNGKHEISCYVDLHSYSQEILYPYAYLCQDHPRDMENLIELAYGMSKTIRLISGKEYTVLPACIDRDSDLIPDLGAGSALDFMYHNKAYWAYQIKLRDTGSHGFLLPSKYIEPVGKEIYGAIKYLCQFILKDDS